MRIVASLLLVVAVIALVNGQVLNPNPPNPRTNYTAKIVIHYPESNLCSVCNLFVSSSLSPLWSAYTPSSGYSTGVYIPTKTATDTFTYTIPFNNTTPFGKYYVSVGYNAYPAQSGPNHASAIQFLNDRCRPVLNNLVGTNKGRQIYFDLFFYGDLTIDVYPYFCRDKGEVRRTTMYSAGLQKDKDIIYHVPAGLVENPIARDVEFLVEFDGYAINASRSLQLDEAHEVGLVPETITLGVDQGTPINPWEPGVTNRSYETTPFPCFIAAPAPSCPAAPGWGGGFITLGFYKNTVIPGIASLLGLDPNVDRSRRSLMGTSNGGHMACVGVWLNSTDWSRAYCSSTAAWMNNYYFPTLVRNTNVSLPVKIVLDVGSREAVPITSATAQLYSAFLEKSTLVLGDNLMYLPYLDGADSHNWNSWSVRTLPALAFLYNDRYTPATTTINSVEYNINIYRDKTRPFGPGASIVCPKNRANWGPGCLQTEFL